MFQFFVCGWTEALSEAKRASVRVVAHGRTANAGLLEVAMSSGTYGSVCGMNAQAAEVACRQLGYDFGVVSPSPCSQYGGSSWCGAAGSAVAVKNLRCTGAELSVDECDSEGVDDGCLSHGGDAVVFCGKQGAAPFPEGQLRLIGAAGAPALPGEAGRLEMYSIAGAWAPVCKLGFTSGSAAVACKQMGFSGSSGFKACASNETCGASPPQTAELACAGSELSVLDCSMSTGEAVFCAPEESVLLTCAGHGDPLGAPSFSPLPSISA